MKLTALLMLLILTACSAETMKKAQGVFTGAGIVAVDTYASRKCGECATPVNTVMTDMARD